LRAGAAAARRADGRGGGGPRDLRLALAVSTDVQTRAGTGGAVALRGRAQRDRRPGAEQVRSVDGGAGDGVARARAGRTGRGFVRLVAGAPRARGPSSHGARRALARPLRG